ncbi:MAG: SpoIVB peptidase [Ruminococcus sp.]|nr:SpoIVB peptidase [Ruminococcus sp.]
MRKILKKTATAIGAAALSVVTLTGFYSRSLPDVFYFAEGSPLSVNSIFPVTAREPDTQKERQALENLRLDLTRLSAKTLMLFDTFPIKNVMTGEISRPTLAASGQPFGIKLMTDGVMVVGLEDIDSSCPASDCGIRVGDVITEIDGKTVTTNQRISEIISSSGGKPCSVSFSRSGKERTATLTPVYSGGTYKAGMWVRDSSAGIGTLTFYDPETGAFGGLGHPICDADTHEPMPVSHGVIGQVKITGCAKSEHGEPGQLIGEFTSSEPAGTITANSDDGVFGMIDTFPAEGELLPLGFKQEAVIGEAEILATVSGTTPERYSVVIESIDLSPDAAHDMVIRVTDERLLRQAGGIVQGMSGSPIIQNGMLIGAVTHVFVDDPTGGYAIFADDMYFNVTPHLSVTNNSASATETLP